MFSSNQIFEISGDLEHKDELRNALEFALRKEGTYEYFTRTEKPIKCAFQIDDQGNYCIGFSLDESDIPEGWQTYQFDFDIDIISRIIEQHLSKQELQDVDLDGSISAGFLMKNIECNTPGVAKPFYGIVMFCPYTCYYAK